MPIEQVNWFLREGCNMSPRCSYCFDSVAGTTESFSIRSSDIKLAERLVDYGLKKVTLTGGEPTLAKNLSEVSRVLKNGGIRVDLHTNGLLLTRNLLDELSDSVTEIGLPIDSTNFLIQSRMRNEIFAQKVSSKISEWTKEIVARGMEVEYHTVFNFDNYRDIVMTYRKLRKNDFSSWKIYEQSFALSENGEDLDDAGTSRIGGTDGLQAEFLLTEDRFRKFNDKRVGFLSRDDRRDYFFIRSDGEVEFYKTHFLSVKNMGNILNDNPREVFGRCEFFYEGKVDDEDFEQFFLREGGLPFFKRYYYGAVSIEEIREIDGRSWPRIERLVDLLEKHETVE